MKWTSLHRVHELGVLQNLDLYFTRRIEHYHGPLQEEEAAVCAATFAAARHGHLCLNLHTDIFSLEEMKEEDKADFIALLQKGFALLESSPDKLKPFLYFNKGRSYLAKNWVLEETLRFHLKRLAQPISQKEIPDFNLKKQLNAEQLQAVQEVLRHRLTLLTGGPGTGKTFTAAAIVQAYTDCASVSLPKICLTAPTARAAEHLKTRLLEAGLDPQIFCYTGTLHSLLGHKNRLTPPTIPWIDAQLIIVDECSMIDAGLLVALLASIPETCSTVLMGDPHQLHPVGIGSLFSDIVYADLNLPLGRAHLRHSLRVDNASLRALIEAVQQNHSGLWPLLDWPLDFQHVEAFYKKLWEFARPFWPPPSSQPPTRDVLVKQLSTFRILSVLRQGPFGSQALNTWLSTCMYALAKPGDFWIAPIQITRNDSATDLRNGELGILVQPWNKNTALGRSEGYAIFPGREDFLPASVLPAHEYAFCTSVHKSQGSEYDEVLLLVPPGSEAFGKEMLYTGITRAKKKLHIASTQEILANVQKKEVRKLSGFHP